ncbi:M42 family metallopeptidase [Butyrivibrio sp. DSM 10294]|uniref:M42 family metallopeptidase n=1 Tax=Butyrivibrio sp. DSM 10294 TaxID=2972457 RepID=UPI00234F0305|nr:M42 family metallopeptidase [Butyrivibrio sp. DSM 10294]MDC7293546.1 M42 family metallopeptidase [Butyrivibrio sp. DSM 10294]
MSYEINEKRFLKELEAEMAIDSVTGQYHELQDYLLKEIEGLGFKTWTLHKGGIMVEAGGEGNPLLVTAHGDTIGLMVRHINSDGTIKVYKVGGLYAFHTERENVRIHTRSGKVITGCVQRKNASVHVTEDELRKEVPDFDTNSFVVLDEDVNSAEDVRALGIEVGDYVALEPRFTVANGYIKSHFIDDKALVAVLMELLHDIKDGKVKLGRKVYIYISFYEEIGHGGSTVPEDVKDYLAVDIACIGPEQTSSEKKVTIFCQDSRFPYNIDMRNELEDAAAKAGADYVRDSFTPHYGTDADPALVAGFDIRHGAIGPGTRASHGYERTHIDALNNTYKVLAQYVAK